jgi:hypothetical protein
LPAFCRSADFIILALVPSGFRGVGGVRRRTSSRLLSAAFGTALVAGFLKTEILLIHVLTHEDVHRFSGYDKLFGILPE